MSAAPQLHGRRFRAGCAYELVVFNRLPEPEQAALLQLAAEPDFYGVLRPRSDSGLTAKSVNRDTALLWMTLQQPGALPFFVNASEFQAASALWELVLDGVLEIEAEDGSFVAGPQASALLGTRAAAPAQQGHLAQLSWAALQHAECSGLVDIDSLAARLYRFGIEPVTPARWARLPDAAAVLSFVGAGTGTALSRRIEAGWDAAQPDLASGWLAWQRKGRGGGQGDGPTHKVYVSPRIEALPTAFDAVLQDLPAGIHAFKIGADAAGLLRPDKMVLYADGPDAVQATAAALAPRLAELPAHGVPFSSELGAGGLLSWGMDPPARQMRLPWQGAESWRLWVVRRLAVALSAALSAALAGVSRGAGGPTPSAADFALERLRHEGVDIDHWTPSTRLWRSA